MKVLKAKILALCFGLWASAAAAQSIPDTEVFLVTLEKKKETLRVGAPINITKRAGYDNQPSFTPDGASVLFTSQRDGQQTDIFQYILKSKTTQQLTSTPDAEYSPLVTPDGKTFSVVRGKEQHLWRFPLKSGDSEPTLLMQMPQLIGYHTWYNKDSLVIAAFPTNPPMSMYLVLPGTKETMKLEEFVGRSLQRVPKKPIISYLVPVSDSLSEIRQIHLKTMKRETLVQALPGSQDFAWTLDGQLLMAQGSKIYQVKPGSGSTWKEIADLSKHGVKNITRMAVSPMGKHLSFVATL